MSYNPYGAYPPPPYSNTPPPYPPGAAGAAGGSYPMGVAPPPGPGGVAPPPAPGGVAPPGYNVGGYGPPPNTNPAPPWTTPQPAPPAERPPREHCFLIAGQSGGLVLEIERASVDPGSRVVLAQRSGQDHQLWYEDTYTGTIRSRLNTYCLHINEYNTVVTSMHIPGEMNQQWVRANDRIQNRQNAGKVLMAYNHTPQSHVVSSPVVQDPRQYWTFPAGGTAAPAPPAPYKPPVNPHGTPQPAPPAAQPWNKPSAAATVRGAQPHRYFYIQSAMHSKVLDIEGENRSPGTKVVMWGQKPSGSADNQLWYTDHQDIIRAKLNDGALQFTNGRITVQRFTGSPDQQWVIQGQAIVLRNRPRTCLDITGENRCDGAQLCQYDYKASSNQHWRQQFLPPRYFFIRSALNNKVLDIDAGNPNPGARVIMWPKKAGGSNNNQLWYLDEQGVIRSRLNNLGLQDSGRCIVTGQACQPWTINGATIVLKSRPDQCLDIQGENRADGATLCQYTYKQSANQHWTYDII